MPAAKAFPSMRVTGAVRRLVVVLGDQLDRASAAFDGFDADRDAVLMMEVEAESTHVPSHRQRTVLFLASMRHFARDLVDRGRRVQYVRLDDPHNTQSFDGEVRRQVERLGPETLVCVHPGEWRVLGMMKSWAQDVDATVEILPDRHFLVTTEDFAQWASGRKSMVMEHFYRLQRTRLGILVDADGAPEGGAPSVDVLVNDGVAIEDLAFTQISPYAELPSDTYNVKVVPADSTMPVFIEADLALDPLTDYSVVAVNVASAIEPIVLVDDNTLDPDMARIRFVHASPNAPAVDIALAGGDVLFGNISFKGVGDYLSVPGGTYDLEVRLAGTMDVVLDVPGVAVTNDRVYTVFAMGLVGNADTPLQAALGVDAAAESRVRVIHASPDAPAVDVRVNDAVALPNIAFTDVTDYAALPFNTYNVKVVPAGMMGPAVIDADLDLLPRTLYSVLAVNVLDEIEPLVLIDDNALDLDMARVRFVHASPNAPAVDIALAGGAVLFGNVEFKGVGDYIMVPGGTYDLEARLAGTDTVVLGIPGVALNNDTVYTAYAMGLVGDADTPLRAVLSLDESCTPDVDDDGETNLHDLIALLSAWGPCSGGDCREDLTGNGDVQFDDLLIMLSRWGACP